MSEQPTDATDRPLTPDDEDWHSIIKTGPELGSCMGCGRTASVHCTVVDRHPSIRAARDYDATYYAVPLCRRCAGMGRARPHLIERFVMNNLDKIKWCALPERFQFPPHEDEEDEE